MTVVLDTGALIALDRGDRDIWSRLTAAHRGGEAVIVPVVVIGQAWRDPGRQVRLSRALKRCTESPMDGPAARAAGVLCGSTGTSDVIDASVALTVAEASNREDGVVLLTSDSPDMKILLAELDTRARLLEV